jgi:hypothetical protein
MSIFLNIRIKDLKKQKRLNNVYLEIPLRVFYYSVLTPKKATPTIIPEDMGV